MKINQKGLDLIKKWEGLRTKAYIDAVGVLTIGYGTTGARVTHGQIITEETAEKWLLEDCQKFETVINEAVKVPLTSNQFSALVVFTYNVGGGAFSSSTLLKKLNLKDYQGSSQEFDRWVNGGGRVLPGLVNRRKEEKALFNEADGVLVNTKGEIPRMSNRIKIVTDTYLKQKIISHTLQTTPDEKIPIYAGSELPFLAAKKEGGHTLFTFGNAGQSIKLAGKNTWFLWGEHFQYAAEKSKVPPKAETLAQKIAIACEAKGYPLETETYNLIGISGLSPTSSRADGYALDNTPDKWNDSILILRYDSEWETLIFVRATTEPGRHYANNPLNANGSAVLDLGLHKSLWRFGLHRGYRALTQAGTARLMRDRNKNHKRDDQISFESGNGVNLHTSKTTGWRGSYSEGSIGQWSAGCCVIPNPDEFKAVLSHLERSPQYLKNPSCLFDFRLLDAGWL